ncbi:MAG TPA: M23 family metallopeptidase [Bacteroidia bacterium]
MQNLSFFKRHALFFIVILLCSSARAGSGGPKDSVTATSKPKSLIQSMNRDQLSSLVDLLFEMDTIPRDLMNEVNTAIAFFNSEDERKELKTSMAFPASDLYVSWEINKLFPERDMLKLKGDTSVTLVLNGGERGDYFHPYDGPVTSGFGWRDSAQHNGIDIDLNKGDKVAAAFDGMVRIAMRYGGFGNVVIIRHYNGLETVYAHLSKLKVKPGQVIIAGEIIGLGGSTGHSTGSHLHFEIRFKGVPINPKYLISFSNQKLISDEITIKKTKWGLAAYPKGEKMYVVEKGDTVFEIAKRYATTTTSIKQMNGLSGRIRLKPGQTINVAQ